FRNAPPVVGLFTLASDRTFFVAEDGRLLFPQGDDLLSSAHHLGSGSDSAVGSPDGRLVAHRRRKVLLFDTLTGNTVDAIPDGEGAGSGLAFSPDGRLLASALSADRTLRLSDVASGRTEVRLTIPGGLGSVAFSPDGRSLAVNAEQRTFVYEVA